jgi:GntR family transcriptional regulator, arabinose operon transcriptional repressor
MQTNLKMPEMMMPSHLAAAKLREEIRKGRYAVGDRLSSEPLLAKKFGVNRGTIRKALTILQQERLIARQRGHGTFVSSPAFGEGTRANVSMIGAMVWEKEYYFGAIIQEASGYSTSRGYMLTTCSNETPDFERSGTDAFIRNGILGVVLAPNLSTRSREAYNRLIAENLPVVIIDSLIPGINEDFVSIDDQQGTYMATQHLIELGHSQIAYVGHNEHTDLPCQPERRAGFLNACRQSDITVPEAWIVEAASLDAQDYLPKLRNLLGQGNRPTAIVTYNDVWAIRIMQVAREFQLNVPNDLSVTGFDNSAVSRDYDIPLTTVSPEPNAVGMTAVDLLISKIEGRRSGFKRKILITPSLVIRKSTAPPRNGALNK